jgi:hypothetical protein
MRRSYDQRSLLYAKRNDSLGGGSRVGLDVNTPDLGVEVECLQSSVSAEVLENINVLYISSDRYL